MPEHDHGDAPDNQSWRPAEPIGFGHIWIALGLLAVGGTAWAVGVARHARLYSAALVGPGLRGHRQQSARQTAR